MRNRRKCGKRPGVIKANLFFVNVYKKLPLMLFEKVDRIVGSGTRDIHYRGVSPCVEWIRRCVGQGEGECEMLFRKPRYASE